MRRLAPCLAALALALGAGCTNPCQELGDRVCSCEPTGNEDACENTVSDQIDSGADQPDQADEDRCEALLDTCVDQGDRPLCTFLETAEGKAACGLAVDPAASSQP